MYVSDNDPYVKYRILRKLALKLGVKPIIVKGAGHFNSAAGYDRFERLLDDLVNTW